MNADEPCQNGVAYEQKVARDSCIPSLRSVNTSLIQEVGKTVNKAEKYWLRNFILHSPLIIQISILVVMSGEGRPT